MKLAIVGSRTFDNYELIEKSILQTFNVSIISCIISGGAQGADTLGEMFGKKYKIPLSIHKPKWDMYGKGAGYVRNKEIVNEADEIIAFWNGSSPGTKMTINYANQVGKKVTIIHTD